MFGSIIKYGLVMAAGGIAFCMTMEYGDASIVDDTEMQLDTQRGKYIAEGTHSDDEVRTLMRAYIDANRGTWEKGIMLAGNLRRLDELYSRYV
jgi:hypothetical protein